MRRLALSCALPCVLATLACAQPKSAPASEAAAPASADAKHERAAEQPAAIEEEAERDEFDADDSVAPPSPAPAENKPMAPAAGGGGGAPGGSIGEASGGLDLRVPAINGGLHRDIIRRTAGTHEAEIRGCVPPALAANPGLADLLTLELEYEGDGKVSKATIPDDSPFTLDAVEDCVRELAEAWSFDAPEGGQGGELTLEIRLN